MNTLHDLAKHITEEPVQFALEFALLFIGVFLSEHTVWEIASWFKKK
jgi:hypothetical protein